MKKINFIVLLILTAFANGQSSDMLVWNNDTLNLYSNPLELRADGDKLNQIISTRIEEQKSIESKDTIFVLPWRNYRTEWIIENDSLFLTKISSFYHNQKTIDIEKILSSNERRIFAEWLTDSLIIFQGNCIVCESNHIKNTSIYPNELIVEFRKGILINKSRYKNQVLKKSKLSNLDPNEYLNYIYSKVNWNHLRKMDRTKQAFVNIQPDKNGKLKKIDWEYTYLISVDDIITNKKNRFLKEAVRIAKEIPDWTVILRHEKIINQGFSIIFSPEMKEKYAR